MQNHNHNWQTPDSPRSVLPPLSKYYYGPAQGRVSPQRVAPDDGSGQGSTSPAVAAPPLPPRHPANPEAFSTSQWMNHFANTEQLWHLPGPPTSAPPESQNLTTVYNPNTYGPMPGNHPSPRRPDGSDWEEEIGNTRAQVSVQIPKPPLPPRPHAVPTNTQAHQGYSDGDSQTEHLQPLSYSPIPPEQSTSGHQPASTFGSSNNGFSPVLPHRVPPAPPPKLPPDDTIGGYQALQGPEQHEPSITTLQMHRYPFLSNQDLSQHSQLFDPINDHVTYSIPSSVWRQEQESQPNEQDSSQPPQHDEPQRSDSFYWQSPHSSVHSINDEGGEITAKVLSEVAINHNPANSDPDNMCKDSGTITTSGLLSHSTLGTYGASALGCGGPSDWEHFGDYEAEEIDDTELYTRSKSPVRETSKSVSAELPASLSTELGPQYEKQSADTQPDHSSPMSCKGPEATIANKALGPGNIGAVFEPERTPENLETEQNSEASVNDLQRAPGHEVHTRAEVSVTLPAPDVSEHGTFASDLDKTIQAWSKSSSLDSSSGARSSMSENERHKESAHGPKAPEDVLNLENGLETSGSRDTLNLPKKSSMDMDSEHSDAAMKTNSEPPSQQLPEQISVNPSAIAHDLQPGGRDDCSPKQSIISQSKKVPQSQPTLVATSGPAAKAKETEDPYAGLDAWGKASLNRYIAMLREESEAGTDRDKLNIFTVFTSRETRLRAVLYGAESEPVSGEAASTRAGSIKRASTTAFKRASKALPALPRNEDHPIPPPVNGHVKKPSKRVSASTILGGTKPASTSLKTLETTNPSSTEDSYVMIESPTGVEYSPGGRPIVPRGHNVDRMSYTSEPESLAVAVAGKISNTDAQSNLPIPTVEEQVGVGQAPGDDTPAYEPFKYSEGRSEAHNYAANRQSKRQSQFRPYAAQRMSSDEYRDMFLIDKPRVVTMTETIAPGKVPLPSNNKVNEETNPDMRRFVHADFDPLLSVLPESGDIHPDSVQISNLQQLSDAIPEDFSFIHQSVVAWDAKARRQRETNERERHARQIESEQRIDALFDDHEIGYGDISELESGFKRSEAARKADEDRSEYKTFVADVFSVVWARLHYEIDQLNPHYVRYTKALNDTTAGKDMFDTSGHRFALAPAMDSLLALHQKLEIRYQKAFEAVLERDRRLKKTELSPWYSLGNVAKVKQLEKQFEDAEKKAIVEYCRQRDIRANNLMDVLDQNTLRGVGANQDYMEMVMKAVRRIASGRAFASQPGAGEPGVGLEEVMKAKSVTKALATSSEQIVQTFHVADMLLNAADYELSVAKAKLSGADAITFQTLKEERAKEDQKLMRDLEHRLALIREDSRRTHDEIVKLLLFLGVQSGHAESSPAATEPTDLGHEERLQKALDEAKRRNALKEAVATTGPP